MKEERRQFFERIDGDQYRDYIFSHCSKDYEKVKSFLERLIDNRFMFDSPWDMEPCSKIHQIQPMVWNQVFEDDPEWAYMLNRQEYLLQFMIGYLVEGDKGYIQKCKFFLFDWIEQVREFRPQSLMTRTLDTGIRSFTWLKLLLLLLKFDLLEEKELEKILVSLEKQIDFMKSHYRAKYTLSNWGILQTIPILATYHFFSDKMDLEEAYHFASKELKQQIETQILEDGSQFEQSILYHVEVYKALLDLCLLLPDLQDSFQELLEKMATYIQMMTGLDGRTLAFGDSDSTETTEILSLSAMVLNKEDLLNGLDVKVDLLSLLFLGREKVKRLQEFEKRAWQPKFRSFEDSGHVCIKDEHRYLFFKNGPLGSAHSHSDENSFCLQYQGQPIFIDAGRYSYREVDERYLLKSAWSHSTCIVDGKAPERIVGSWEYEYYPHSLFCHHKEREGVHYIEGAYLSAEPDLPYLHRRKILMLAEDVWLLVDDIRCQGQHEALTQFILDKDVTYQDGKINQLKLRSEVDFDLEATIISPKYNELEKSSKLTKHQFFENQMLDYTIIAHESFEIIRHSVYQTDGHQVENALAFEVKNDETDKLILLLSEDICVGEKLCLVDGTKMRGKCLVYDKINERMIRLQC